MVRAAQMGLALGALGIVVALMGLFPGVVGFDPTPGIGVTQILVVLVGMALFVLGGIMYAKYMFFARQPSTLVQQIGVRMALTGLMFAALTSLADVLGFGSNVRTDETALVFGPLQGAGLVLCFAVAGAGVLMYVLGGEAEMSEDADA